MELTYITFITLVLLQIKHFICDFPLQGVYMLRKMDKEDWIVPLLAHATVHAVGTFIVIVAVLLYSNVEAVAASQLAFALACIDVVLHFVVGRVKASPNLGALTC